MKPHFKMVVSTTNQHIISQWLKLLDLPSGKLTFCYGKSPFWMGKSTISMAIFNSYVNVYHILDPPTRQCWNTSRIFAEPSSPRDEARKNHRLSPSRRVPWHNEKMGPGGSCWFTMIYPWKIGHRNSWFTHEKWWFSLIFHSYVSLN